MEQVIEYMSNRLSEFFIITDDPYEGATDFNKKHHSFVKLKQRELKDGKRMSPLIHRLISEEAIRRFGVIQKKIGESRMDIDLWDEHRKIAYEIILGNGEEIWKDILKAILVKARKLVVFCRNYPDETIKGCLEVENTLKNLQPFLSGRLNVQVVLIKPKR